MKSVQSTLKAALVTSIKKGLRLLEENDLLSSVMDSLALLGATEHAELALKKAGGGAHLRRKRHTLASLQATAARVCGSWRVLSLSLSIYIFLRIYSSVSVR